MFEGQTDPTESLDELTSKIEKEAKEMLGCSKSSDTIYVKIIQITESACRCSGSQAKEVHCSCPKHSTIKGTAANEANIEQVLENESHALDLAGHGRNVLFILEGDYSSKG